MSNEKALAIKEESFRLSPVMTTKERKKELEMIRAFVKGELKVKQLLEKALYSQKEKKLGNIIR